MTALAYTCPSRYGPYECGAADFWAFRILGWGLGALLAVMALVWLVLWATDLDRPWRRQARAEAARQRGLERLDREARRRERAERPAEGHSPFRRPPGNQPW